MARAFIAGQIRGGKAVRRAFNRLSKAARNRIVPKAASKSATQFSRALKKEAPRPQTKRQAKKGEGSRHSIGATRRSIGKRVKRKLRGSKSGEVVWAGAGPRAKWEMADPSHSSGRRVPANYYHLILYGFRNRGGRVAGDDFRLRAWNRSKRPALTTYRREVKRAIIAEARKQRAAK